MFGTDWAPVTFSVFVPVLATVLLLLGRLLFMVGRILGTVAEQLQAFTRRLSMLETARTTDTQAARAVQDKIDNRRH